MVKAITLKSLLRPEALGKVSAAASWRFCASPECDTVYFDEAGTASFAKRDLTVRVGIKESTAPRPICYCFDHSMEEVEEQIRATGKTSVPADIKTRMQEGCWCETKSPLGACCLATVTKCARGMQEKLGATARTDLNTTDCCAVKTDVPAASSTGREKLVWVGSVASALAASACCWLPLLLLAFGMSGAAVSAAFEKYRPFFAALTIGFLGAAFYLLRRPRAGVNRLVFGLVAAVTVVFLLFPNWLPILQSRATPIDDANAVVLQIDGMTCEGCSAGLEQALTRLSGVQAAQVEYATGRARVRPGTNYAPAEVEATIRSLGFKLVHEEQERK